MKKRYFAISIVNDPEFGTELWGPYTTKEVAEEVKDAFIGVPESASIVEVQENAEFTGRPE